MGILEPMMTAEHPGNNPAQTTVLQKVGTSMGGRGTGLIPCPAFQEGKACFPQEAHNVTRGLQTYWGRTEGLSAWSAGRRDDSEQKGEGHLQEG